MKFVFICAALVCTNLYFCQGGNTSGNQNVCATPTCPININVHGNEGIKGEKGAKGDTGAKGDNGTPCQCPLQNPSKPSAHIEAANKRVVTYQASQMIKDWSASAPFSHLAGGMKYQDGKLTVPTPGRYYIYAQIYYSSSSPAVIVYFRVNNKIITMIQSPSSGKDEGSLYAGGVFILKAGDVITFTSASNNCKIYMWSYHSYFGAFLI